MMKILIISGSFYPENSPRAFRTTELAKEFVITGHDVTVLIPETNYDFNDFILKYPMKIKYFKCIQERRKFIGISILDRVIFRLLNQFLSYPSTFQTNNVYRTAKQFKGYDLLLTIAVPHSNHWAVGKLYSEGKKIASHWIADCGDSFMLVQTGKYRPMFYFKSFETRWCRLCDYITVPTEACKDGYYPEFRNKIRVIPQGFNFSEIMKQEYFPHTVPTFAYSGVFIPGERDIRPLLDILIKKSYNFELHIYTRKTDLLEPYKEQLHGKMIIHDYIPRLELLERLSTMDFLLNLENGIPNLTPSKLIDYALCGRPIMSINSSKIDESLVDDFMNGNYSRQYIVKDIERYDIHNVAQQFLDLVHNSK